MVKDEDTSKDFSEQVEETEIDWRDSQIRWEEDGPQKKRDASDEEEDEDEEAYGSDLFAPDPHKTFTYSFRRINGCGGDISADLPPILITLQGYTYESDQTWSSTGMTLWRASEYLCNYLVQNWDSMMKSSTKLTESKLEKEYESAVTDTKMTSSKTSAPRRILELGAGLGLCGLLAHHLGDALTSIYITDGDKDVLVKLRENLALNRKPTTTTTSASATGHVSCHQLLWGKDYSTQFLERAVVGQKKFNLIIAADVVYVKSVVQPLWETVENLLDHHDENAIFVLAFARRLVDVTVNDVLAAAAEAGFVHTLQSTREEVENGLFLYVFRRKR